MIKKGLNEDQKIEKKKSISTYKRLNFVDTKKKKNKN